MGKGVSLSASELGLGSRALGVTVLMAFGEGLAGPAEV